MTDRQGPGPIRRRAMLAGFGAAFFIPSAALALPDPAALARLAAGDAGSPTEKIRRVVRWTHENLQWTATDYRSRSVLEILERGGGNCREQALVVQDFLARLDIASRMVREVNVQPADAARQESAAAMVAERGPRASVFGRRHNDHVWIEYFDAASAQWLPSDPTINIVGLDNWISARLGFGTRPVHDIVPYADMLFPITVLAVQPDGGLHSRTRHYLVDGFAQHVPGVAAAPSWPSWVELVATADAHLIRAFRGEYDFHRDDALVGRLIDTYQALRRESHASS